MFATILYVRRKSHLELIRFQFSCIAGRNQELRTILVRMKLKNDNHICIIYPEPCNIAQDLKVEIWIVALAIAKNKSNYGGFFWISF